MIVLLRELAPQVLAAVARRYRDFDVAEDATQEALLAAAQQWPAAGVPDDPRAWLVRVASRRVLDHVRAELARRRRQGDAARADEVDAQPEPDGAPRGDERDDTLAVLFACCHPALTASSQLALTLRAVGGLTTAEIAAATFVPEATMAQRISRAKQTIAKAGARFEVPDARERDARLPVVLHVVYMIFNEGYATTRGDALVRADLAAEAIRIARLLHRVLPDEPEVAGLLALLLLTDARREARTTARGELVPLDEQDRTRWDRAQIDEGVALLAATLPRGAVGPYQLQAAIAAVHDEAPTAAATDWPQILALYDVLARIQPDHPMVALARAVAVAMVHGPDAGLALLPALAADPRLADSHRVDAVRAHLLELRGDRAAALASYRAAAAKATSAPERDYLRLRAAALADR